MSLLFRIDGKDKYQEKLDELKEMIAVAKLEKMTLLEQQLCERYNELVKSNDEQQKSFEVKLRDKNRIQVKKNEFIFNFRLIFCF